MRRFGQPLAGKCIAGGRTAFAAQDPGLPRAESGLRHDSGLARALLPSHSRPPRFGGKREGPIST